MVHSSGIKYSYWHNDQILTDNLFPVWQGFGVNNLFMKCNDKQIQYAKGHLNATCLTGDFTFAKSVHEEQLRALTEGHKGGKKKWFQLWKLGENLFLSSWGKQCENADTSGEFTGLQTLSEFLKFKVNPHRKRLFKSPAGVCRSRSGSSADTPDSNRP